VPWCAPCDRFLSPSTVRTDGTCPTCGRPVDAGRAHAAEPAPRDVARERISGDDAAPVPVPWHLKLLLAALAVYLAYRAYQGVAWLITQL
jgi:hypothetical protein